MQNMFDVLDFSFLDRPHFELANTITNIGQCIDVHPGHQGGFPELVADGKKLMEVGQHYNGLASAALTGGPIQEAARDAYRPIAIRTAATTLTWISIKSVNENDISLITNIGVDHKKDKPQSQTRNTTPILLLSPENVKLKQGKSQEVWVTISKVKGAITYFVQYCTSEPGREESWMQEVHFSKCRDVITGLEPGKLYYFRVRAFGHAGYGPWSSIVSMMVI